MAFYTRRQLVLLLLAVATVAFGLAVGHWRRAQPELVERLERFDRDPAAVAPDAAAPAPGTEPPAADPQAGRAGGGRAPMPREDSARRPPPKRASDASPLDVNHATAADLSRLPGVGPTLAERIVQAREGGGPFASIDDLRRVKGVGRARVERLRPLVSVTE
jgi:competence ComEA-like helix-hairpin-helix protein